MSSQQLGAPATFAGALVAVFLLARSHGGYSVDSWGPAVVLGVLVLAGLVALGRRPSRFVLIASGALVSLGGWAVISVSWGGIPDEAWTFFAKSLLAASALCIGCLLAVNGRGEVVAVAVLGGIGLAAVEILLGPLVGWYSEEWYYSRTLEGTIGYHNGQASICAIGISLATWALSSRRAGLRILGGLSLGILVATIFLTQSRAGLAAAVVGVVVVLLWTRDAMQVLRVIPVVIAAPLLSRALRDVDRALVEGGVGKVEASLDRYALIALVIATGIGLTALPNIASKRIRRVAVSAVVVLAAASVVGGLVVAASSGALSDAADSFDDSNPNLAEGGSTRLVSVSLNGRRDAWRIAWTMAQEQPLLGNGMATFTGRYTIDRADPTLYILQPHSLVMEVLSELGLVGITLLLLAVGVAALAAARGSDRPLAGAALGALTAVVAQAAVDWTWSFPILLVATFLVVGAASETASVLELPLAVVVVAALVSLVAILVAIAPWMSDRALERAETLRAGDLTGASAELQTALRWNRWNPLALELQAEIAEETGSYSTAAAGYHLAASRSRTGWLDFFREARAARAAGDEERRRRACDLATAANPGERRLREALC